MRFIYAFLALALSLCASAAAPKMPAAKKHKPASALTAKSQRSLKAVSLKKVSRADEEIDADIAGDYVLVLADYYFEESVGIIEADATIADNGDGTITISCPEQFGAPVTAAYDPSTLKMTILPTPTTVIDAVDFFGQLFYITFDCGKYVEDEEDNGDLVSGEISAEFFPEDGAFDFAEDTFMGWRAYDNGSDFSEEKFIGWLNLFDILGGIKAEPIDEEQVGQWKSIGTATFVDAWITTAYADMAGNALVPSDYPIQAELQQNVDNENIYRLWAPYHSEDFVGLEDNVSNYQGQIVFDVTNPDNVVVKAGLPAGFNDGEFEFYTFNALGWVINYFGEPETEDEWIDYYNFLAEEGIPSDTFKNGVVTINESIFDVARRCETFYYWEKAATAVSTITFPNAAVEEINVAESNTRYYNLQGQRIARPNGLTIRLKNGKAEKII